MPARGILVPAGWVTSRILKGLPAGAGPIVETSNDLGLVGGHGLANVSASFRFSVRRNAAPADEPFRGRWLRLQRSARWSFGWISVHRFLTTVLNDEGLRAGGDPSIEELAFACMTEKGCRVSYENPNESDWQTEYDVCDTPRFMLNWMSLLYLEGWRELGAVLRFLDGHPRRSIHVRYGWEPSLMEVTTDPTQLPERLAVRLSLATNLVEFLQLACRVVPDSVPYVVERPPMRESNAAISIAFRGR